MINRRLLGTLAGLALLLGITAPAGAACGTSASGATAAHSEHHAGHSSPASPSHRSSHENPCGSHDSNCCAAMMSCGSMAMTGRIFVVSAPLVHLEPARQFNLFAPATPTFSVEPPPPRA